MLRRWVGVLVVVVTCALGVTPAAAAEKNTARAGVQAFRLYLERAGVKQWGRVHKTMHPVQRRVVTVDELIACMENREDYWVANLDISETYYERLTIPGDTDRSKTLAITFGATLRNASGESTFTNTAHMIYAQRRWTWALSASAFEQCQR